MALLCNRLPLLLPCLALIAKTMGCCGDDKGVSQGAKGNESAARVLWTSRISEASRLADVRIAASDTGEVVVAATVQGDVNVAGLSLPATRGPLADTKHASAEDVLVVKLSAGGKQIWGQRFGDGTSQRVTSVAVTGAGTAFVGGTFEGTLRWGNHEWKASDGAHGGFVATIDPAGMPGWGTYFDAIPLAKDRTVKSSASVRALGTDSMGRLFIMGVYQGRFRIHGQTPIADSEDRIGGTFFARFDRAGALRWYKLASWSKSRPDALHAQADAMCTNGVGDVVLVGRARGQGTFVHVPMKAHDDGSLFVSVWDQTGKHIWTQLFETTGKLDQVRVACAEDGNLYLVGTTRGEVTMGNQSVHAPTEAADLFSNAGTLFAARLDVSGNPVWLKPLGIVDTASPLGLAADGKLGFVASGRTVARLSDVGGGRLFESSAPGANRLAFAAAFGTDGAHRWSRGFSAEYENPEYENRSGGDLSVPKPERVFFATILGARSCEGSCVQRQLGDVFIAALGK